MKISGSWTIANDGVSLLEAYSGYTKPALDLYTYLYQYDFDTPLLRARTNQNNNVGDTIFQVNQNGNIYTSGSIGIGTTTPVSELQVVGTITTTALVETSAQRYKEDIKPLESQLEKVNKLNPVNFTWKENKKEDVGFIAEEMQEIFPELVSESADGQVEGIQYSKLTAVLVKALQEQQKQINDLKEEIFILKNK